MRTRQSGLQSTVVAVVRCESSDVLKLAQFVKRKLWPLHKAKLLLTNLISDRFGSVAIKTKNDALS